MKIVQCKISTCKALFLKVLILYLLCLFTVLLLLRKFLFSIYCVYLLCYFFSRILQNLGCKRYPNHYLEPTYPLGFHSVIPPFLRGASTLPKVIKTGGGNFTDKRGISNGMDQLKGGSVISMIKIFSWNLLRHRRCRIGGNNDAAVKYHYSHSFVTYLIQLRRA